MKLGAAGLSDVPTPDLMKLLRALHKGELTAPLDRKNLTEVGFFHLGDELDILRGLDTAGVRAVLVAVLAERR